MIICIFENPQSNNFLSNWIITELLAFCNSVAGAEDGRAPNMASSWSG